jgi:hypothetical protein
MSAATLDCLQRFAYDPAGKVRAKEVARRDSIRSRRGRLRWHSASSRDRCMRSNLGRPGWNVFPARGEALSTRAVQSGGTCARIHSSLDACSPRTQCTRITQARAPRTAAWAGARKCGAGGASPAAFGLPNAGGPGRGDGGCFGGGARHRACCCRVGMRLRWAGRRGREGAAASSASSRLEPLRCGRWSKVWSNRSVKAPPWYSGSAACKYAAMPNRPRPGRKPCRRP